MYATFLLQFSASAFVLLITFCTANKKGCVCVCARVCLSVCVCNCCILYIAKSVARLCVFFFAKWKPVPETEAASCGRGRCRPAYILGYSGLSADLTRSIERERMCVHAYSPSYALSLLCALSLSALLSYFWAQCNTQRRSRS